MTTIAQALQAAGMAAHLRVDGILVEADNVQRFKVLVEDATASDDPVLFARSQSPVYVRVTALSKDVHSPRSIQLMRELPNGRGFRALRVIASYDPVYVAWLCEVERQ